MKISQDIRDEYGAARAPNEISDEAAKGMAEKSKEFREKGGEVYLSEDGSAREPID